LIPAVCDLAEADWVITNPPFRLAEDFILQALRVAKKGVAMLVRSAFLEGKGRYKNLFCKTPPRYILQFVERVPMQKNSLNKDISTATAYTWIIWVDGCGKSTKFDWVPPCRGDLESGGDYPEMGAPEEGPLLLAMRAAQ